MSTAVIPRRVSALAGSVISLAIVATIVKDGTQWSRTIEVIGQVFTSSLARSRGQDPSRPAETVRAVAAAPVGMAPLIPASRIR